jgi:hypothetical protein
VEITAVLRMRTAKSFRQQAFNRLIDELFRLIAENCRNLSIGENNLARLVNNNGRVGRGI